VLWLFKNKIKEIDRKCFEPLKSIEVIELYENNDLKALSFVNPSTKFSYNKEKVNKYGSLSDWNMFLQQFSKSGNILLNLYIKLFRSLEKFVHPPQKIKKKMFFNFYFIKCSK
jgi:hypothetical protein